MPEREIALHVEVRTRLIEHDQTWVAIKGARQANALPVAAGQVGAALLDQRVVALRQFQDQFVRPGEHRGFHDLVVLAGTEAGDIRCHGVGEKFDLLRQVADMTAEVGARPGRDIGAVEPDHAAGRRLDADDQPRQR